MYVEQSNEAEHMHGTNSNNRRLSVSSEEGGALKDPDDRRKPGQLER